jgi:hypothetical protein
MSDEQTEQLIREALAMLDRARQQLDPNPRYVGWGELKQFAADNSHDDGAAAILWDYLVGLNTPELEVFTRRNKECWRRSHHDTYVRPGWVVRTDQVKLFALTRREPLYWRPVHDLLIAWAASL